MISYPRKIEKLLLKMQRNELTEYHVYRHLAKKMKNSEDKTLILNIAKTEKIHYEFWKQQSDKTVKAHKIKIGFYCLLTMILGYTFTLKLMEKNESLSAKNDQLLSLYISGADEIEKQEQFHKKEMLKLLNEERLNYVGSMVLGLNDALVELTGALAGLTLALSTTKLISISALITGIAAALSMAASEFLRAKADGKSNALKSAVYTGITYLVTVILLIIPYIIITDQRFLSLGLMLGIVICIIFSFNYFISVAKSEPFQKRFWQMIVIGLTVTVISFLMGFLVKNLFGVTA